MLTKMRAGLGWALQERRGEERIVLMSVLLFLFEPQVHLLGINAQGRDEAFW